MNLNNAFDNQMSAEMKSDYHLPVSRFGKKREEDGEEEEYRVL